MVAENLSPDLDDQQFNENRVVPRPRFVFQDLSVNGTGDWLILPAGIGEMLVSVEPSSGTARVEYTQDPVADVVGATATGKPWPAGDVDKYTDQVMGNVVTAIRCVSTADAKFKVSS